MKKSLGYGISFIISALIIIAILRIIGVDVFN